MKGDVPIVVEQTNSAVSVSLILNTLGVMVAIGGTVSENTEKEFQVTTQS